MVGVESNFIFHTNPNQDSSSNRRPNQSSLSQSTPIPFLCANTTLHPTPCNCIWIIHFFLIRCSELHPWCENAYSVTFFFKKFHQLIQIIDCPSRIAGSAPWTPTSLKCNNNNNNNNVTNLSLHVIL